MVQPEAGAAFVAGGHPCTEFIAQRTGGTSVFAGSVFINIDFPFLAAGVAAFVRFTGKGGEEGRENGNHGRAPWEFNRFPGSV